MLYAVMCLLFALVAVPGLPVFWWRKGYRPDAVEALFAVFLFLMFTALGLGV